MMRTMASLTLVLALLVSGTALGDDKQTTERAVASTGSSSATSATH